MNWVIVDNKYLDFLRTNYESRIPITNYGTEKYKPFFGELFKINKFSYITQITSYKPRFLTLKESKDFYKVYQKNKIIAGINLNYMFPVLSEDIEYLNNYNDIGKYRTFNDEQEKIKYIALLKYELKELNKKPLTKNAQFLYCNKYKKPDSILAKRCFDFKELEKHCVEYSQIKN